MKVIVDGEKISSLLDSMDLSKQKVSEITGISVGTIKNCCKGSSVNISTFVKMCTLIGVNYNKYCYKTQRLTKEKGVKGLINKYLKENQD